VGDLVVRTRVAVAQRNLARVVDLAATIARGESGLAGFLQLPEELTTKVRKLLQQVRELKVKLTPYETDLPDLVTGLSEMETGLSQELADLRGKSDVAGRLQSALLTLPGERKDVADFLLQKADELARSLNEQNYWSQAERCEGLFYEYVDLLRGVALRNAGFGDEEVMLSDLFLIADRLPSLWGRVEGWAWRSLAVPSRTERNASTEAMVLRIGFPEWTIWALPLVQHEFGHVFVKRGRLLSGLPGQDSEAAQLADALATLVTGPAYACAALMLRLDPGAVRDAGSYAALRSATILATLQSEAAQDSPLEMLTERLRVEWRDAVAGASGATKALDQALASPEVAGIVKRARQVIPGVGPGGMPASPFWAERWGTIASWANKLKQGDGAGIDLLAEERPGDDRPLALAMLLDAAWLARVSVTADDDAKPKQLELVARTAIDQMLAGTRPPAPTKPTNLGGNL
jgi:hypothetical protein